MASFLCKATVRKPDLRLSKSHSQEHFDASVTLFLAKYKNEEDASLVSAVSHLKKFGAVKAIAAGIQGVEPGTLTTNNGLEVQTEYLKKIKGKFYHCLFIFE